MGNIEMYEFRVTVGMERGGEQVFIVNAEAESEKEAEDQIRYLVENSLEVLGISEIKMGN
jgi:hypothetical protein